MSLHANIETILDRNDAWIKEFEVYETRQKEPLLHVDMQSPSVNQMFSELSKRLNQEKLAFMQKRLQECVPDITAEKETLQTYQKILQSESKQKTKPKHDTNLPFFSLCVPQKPQKVEPMIHAVYIDRINRQLPYYE